jgi:hypothetical protein
MLKKFLVRAKVLFQKEVGRFQALLLWSEAMLYIWEGLLGRVLSLEEVPFILELNTKLSWPAKWPVSVYFGLELCTSPTRAWASPHIWFFLPMTFSDSLVLNEIYTRCIANLSVHKRIYSFRLIPWIKCYFPFKILK